MPSTIDWRGESRDRSHSAAETRPARLRARKAQTGIRTLESFSKTWENDR